MERCKWVTNDQVYIDYHDSEWGIPVYDDQKLFEMLILEGAQAGLNWITILKRREAYREAFDNFDVNKISLYTEEKLEQLMKNDKIIRNKKKIYSVVQNAKSFLNIVNDYGSFSSYLWSFVNGTPIINHWVYQSDVPTQSELSIAISKDLKKKGFSFVGPTIIYSYLQAVGVINDHIVSCFCHPHYKEEKAN